VDGAKAPGTKKLEATLREIPENGAASRTTALEFIGNSKKVPKVAASSSNRSKKTFGTVLAGYCQ